ncbi:MAG: hypothetical protein B7Y99_11200 [Caulobacterales bacterium 32-69-10]|nr:MAG: hypothetical protein B7Y99_11200 [Caulobacterales bacterium 32-69-10]
MRLALFAASALALAVATPASAWEETGHRMVARLAVEAFPEELPAFLRTKEAAWSLTELSREADRSKGAGQPHDADLDPAHFVDVDDAGKVLNGPALAALPRDREDYEKALQAAGTNSWDAGWLPYTIVEGWQQLAKDFAYWRAARVGEKTGKTRAERRWFAQDRKLREALIIRDLGYWSHFVGDGSQPLHVTMHYNGWGDHPNPNNYTKDRIHGPFEGAFVAANATDAAVRAAMKPYSPCGCTVQVSTARFLGEASGRLVPLYELWGQGGFTNGDPRGTAFVVERLASGATQLRDMVVDAWRASPDFTVGYPPTAARVVEETGKAPFETIYGRQ